MLYFYRQLIKTLKIYPALRAEQSFPTEKRRKSLVWIERLVIVDVLFFALTSQGFFLGLEAKIAGLGLLLMCLWLWIYLIELFVRYYERQRGQVDWLLALVLFSIEGKDLAGGFMNTAFGRKVAKRAEISTNELEIFLKGRRSMPIPETNFRIDDFSSVADFFRFILENNPDLENIFLKKGLNRNEAVRVVVWEEETFHHKLVSGEWWRKDRLARVPSIGRDWSFGRADLLNKYGRIISDDIEVEESGRQLSVWQETVDRLANVLVKKTEPNAILVGESSASLIEPLWLLSRQIKSGTVSPVIEGKKIFMLSASSLVADFADRASLENGLVNIAREAIKAGNIILAVDNISVLISVLRDLGGDLGSVWGDILAGGFIRVIGLVEENNFHNLLTTESNLFGRFEIVQAQKISPTRLVDRMISDITEIEKETNLFFSYQSLSEITKSAEAFFSEGDLVDEVKDLLVEIVPWVKSRKIEIIDKSIVKTFVGEKTGVPLAGIDSAEKEKLVDLENVLAKRVVGQKESLIALSGALRRSRAGTRNPNRPIGSFLFLGPTGVGKTETAKALAETMFGDEKALSRIDMSEFVGADAMEKIAGSASGRAGALSKLVKEKPYGVLLLDEFEKTSGEILNLFLQILDEGFFTDGSGQKIILRNMVIIATSNAGADQIWDLVRSGANLSGARDQIIDSLVKKGLFRPELLNRFDATIIYSPLSESDLLEIAKLQLGALAKRLLAQGLKLNITDNLTREVAKAGQSREFGARPLARFIQDRVEEPIASEIIAGRAVPGSILEFGHDLSLKIKTL